MSNVYRRPPPPPPFEIDIYGNVKSREYHLARLTALDQPKLIDALFPKVFILFSPTNRTATTLHPTTQTSKRKLWSIQDLVSWTSTHFDIDLEKNGIEIPTKTPIPTKPVTPTAVTAPTTVPATAAATVPVPITDAAITAATADAENIGIGVIVETRPGTEAIGVGGAGAGAGESSRISVTFAAGIPLPATASSVGTRDSRVVTASARASTVGAAGVNPGQAVDGVVETTPGKSAGEGVEGRLSTVSGGAVAGRESKVATAGEGGRASIVVTGRESKVATAAGEGGRASTVGAAVATPGTAPRESKVATAGEVAAPVVEGSVEGEVKPAEEKVEGAVVDEGVVVTEGGAVAEGAVVEGAAPVEPATEGTTEAVSGAEAAVEGAAVASGEGEKPATAGETQPAVDGETVGEVVATESAPVKVPEGEELKADERAEPRKSTAKPKTAAAGEEINTRNSVAGSTKPVTAASSSTKPVTAVAAEPDVEVNELVTAAAAEEGLDEDEEDLEETPIPATDVPVLPQDMEINTDIFEKLGEEAFTAMMMATRHTILYLDVTIDSVPQGRILIELYDDVVPTTSEHFLKFVDGKAVHPIDGETLLKYSGTAINRLIPDGWLQSGAFPTAKDELMGQPLPDENFVIKHAHRGMLSLVNYGPHSNYSQFMITFRDMPYFDRKFVCIGRCVDGCETLEKIESVPTRFEKPLVPVEFSEVGVFIRGSW
ncbi:putative inactive peptidyl-prolyl cis-trans isomerase-like 6 [Blyttiomyces sp. JEL0837]|nr:putative inactive peptidyl-prolyl cis-trans isomerase-like 6 [Blyttiomyces sp. JEL0837]